MTGSRSGSRSDLLHMSDEDADAHEGASLMASRQRKNDIASRDQDICGHCMKRCTKTGSLSKAIQCDYCKFWFHAKCEDLSN